jgi:hypothetical protein
MGLTMPATTVTTEGDGGVEDVFGNDLSDVSVWEDDPFMAASSFNVRNVVNQAIEIARGTSVTTKESMFQTPSSAFLPPRTPGWEQRKKVGMSMVVAPPRTPASSTNRIRRRASAGGSTMDASGFVSPTTPCRPQLRMSLTPTCVKTTKLLTSDELLHAKQHMQPKPKPPHQDEHQQLATTLGTAIKQNLTCMIPPSLSDSPVSLSPSSVMEHAFPVEWTADPLDQFVESRVVSPSSLERRTARRSRSPRSTLNIKVVYDAPTPTTTTRSSTANHSPPPPHHRRRSSSTNGEQRRRQRSLPRSSEQPRTPPSTAPPPPPADNTSGNGEDGCNVDPQQSPRRVRSPLAPRAQRRGSAGGVSSSANPRMTPRISAAASSSISISHSHYGGRVRLNGHQGPFSPPPPRAVCDVISPKPSPMMTRTRSDPSDQVVSPRRARAMSEAFDVGVVLPPDQWKSSFSRWDDFRNSSNNPLEEKVDKDETPFITQKVEGEDKNQRQCNSISKRLASPPDTSRRSPLRQRHSSASSSLGVSSPPNQHPSEINHVEVGASLLKPKPLWNGETKEDHDDDAGSNLDLTPPTSNEKRPSLAGRKIKYARRGSGDAGSMTASTNAVVVVVAPDSTHKTDIGSNGSKASSRRRSSSRSSRIVAKENGNDSSPPPPLPQQENSTTSMRRRSMSPATVKMVMTTRGRSPLLPPNLPPTPPKTERAVRRGSATGTKELMMMKPLMIMSPLSGGTTTTATTGNHNKLVSPSPRRKIQYMKRGNVVVVEGDNCGGEGSTTTSATHKSITSTGAVLLDLPPISMENHTIDLRSIVELPSSSSRAGNATLQK